MTRTTQMLFAAAALASSLLGCAAPGTVTDDIAAATAAAVYVDLGGTETALLQRSEPVREPQLVERYYVSQGCEGFGAVEAARVSAPDAEYLVLEHLVACDNGRTPSVVSVFASEIDGAIADAAWLTTYGVGPSLDGGAIERVEIVGGIATAQHIEFFPVVDGVTVSGIDARVDPPAPASEVAYAFSFVASGSGVGEDCGEARARAGWETTANAQGTCYDAGGTGAYALYSSESHLQESEQTLDDGTCEVHIRVSYDCFAPLLRAPASLDLPPTVSGADAVTERVRQTAATLFVSHPNQAERDR